MDNFVDHDTFQQTYMLIAENNFSAIFDFHTNSS